MHIYTEIQIISAKVTFLYPFLTLECLMLQPLHTFNTILGERFH